MCFTQHCCYAKTMISALVNVDKKITLLKRVCRDLLFYLVLNGVSQELDTLNITIEFRHRKYGLEEL